MSDLPSPPSPAAPSEVPPAFAALEKLSPSEIELEVSKLRNKDPKTLTDEEVERAVALHRLARRRTAGPPKAKSGAKSTPVSLDNLGLSV